MICSLIGSFLLVYVAIITFMNILGYPLEHYLIVSHKDHLSIRKIYIISFLLQLLAMFMLLEEGHITTLPLPSNLVQITCIFFAVILSFMTYKNSLSHYEEKKYFMAPLLLIISCCFWLTLFHA